MKRRYSESSALKAGDSIKENQIANWISKRTFFRYLLYYMAYLILLFVLMIVFYLQNVRYWRENELKQYELTLSGRVEEFWKQLNNISMLGQQIEEDARYQTLSRQESDRENADYVKTAAIQKSFNGSLIPYPLVTDSGICFQNGVIVTRWLSFVGSQGIKEYYQDYFHVEDMDRDEWFAFLSSPKTNHLYTGATVSSYVYGKSEAMIWKEPIYFGTLYVVIRKEELARFFLPEEEYEEGYFYIVSDREEECLSYQYGEDTDKSSFYEISQYDPHTLLTYKIGVPRAHVDILMRKLIWGMAIYGILVLAGGGVLAIFFSYRNNRPIRRLAIFASAYDKSALSKEIPRNGYDYVAQVMERQQISLKKVTRQLEQKRVEEKRHLLDKAIQGGLNSNDLIRQFGEFFPDLMKECRIVILILPESLPMTNEVQLSRNLLVQEALKEFYGYDITITSTYPDIIVFVLPDLLEKKLQAEGKTTAGELWRFLERDLNQQVQISVSEPFSHILEIPWVYILTLQQFRAKIGSEETSALQKGEYGQDMSIFFNFMYYQQLFEALSNGEETIAVSLIKKIESEVGSATNGFENRQLGEAVCRSFYTSNLSGLYNIFVQVKLNYFGILNAVSIPMLQFFQDVSSYFEALIACCEQICRELEENKRRFRKRQLQHQIMMFLEGHISDSNLSAQMTADFFHISYNTLQKIVRDSTGKTLSEYVEERRIEAAIRLLKSTEDSVESIALQSGFSSYNSMYKVFKRRYHMAPREAAEMVKTVE